MAGRDRARGDGPPDGAHDWLQAEPVLVCREGFDGNAGVGLRLFGDDIGDFYGMARPSLWRSSLAGD